ncbi:MAG: helix-turn-helix transcriptional regulator [Oscillospiraceae bacterium]|nr:helix-turn-helix transcriptional regulator [Oscillospiraceae bacterium]
MDYVERLTALRVDRDIGQKEISEVLKCNQPAVSKYENRRAKYSVEDIIALCQFYKVSADYILGLPEGMPYPKR